MKTMAMDATKKVVETMALNRSGEIIMMCGRQKEPELAWLERVN
jgi:hypothetical protein